MRQGWPVGPFATVGWLLAACLAGCSLGEDLDRYQTPSAPDPSDAADGAAADGPLPESSVDAQDSGDAQDSANPPADAGCEGGATRTCYSGAPGTEGKGECKSGQQTCQAGTWTACTGEVLPTTELCDGFDNDCNGVDDDGCTCVTGQSRACGSDVGACEFGLETCSDQGQWGPCEGEVTGQLEVCDAIDNNCDGTADENLQRTCYPGPDGTKDVGMCKAGAEVCTSGSWGTCVGAVLPSLELCNGVDDDCDDVVDNSVADEACYSGSAATEGVGVCHGGLRSCDGGTWGSCQNEVLPSPELCNGADDDCNGAVDDEPAKIHFGGACDEQCLDSSLDADCDGLVGDGAQDKWPSECNPLLLSEEFGGALDPVVWASSTGVTSSCGQALLPAGGSLTLLAPPAQLGIQYLAETLVTLGPAPASGEWYVSVSSAFAPNNERRCRIWSHVVTGNKPTPAVEVLYGGSTYGTFIGNLALDTQEGASFVLQSFGTKTTHYCRVLQPNGEALLGEISTYPIAPALTNTEGSVRLYTLNRAASFDYLRIFGYTP